MSGNTFKHFIANTINTKWNVFSVTIVNKAKAICCTVVQYIMCNQSKNVVHETLPHYFDKLTSCWYLIVKLFPRFLGWKWQLTEKTFVYRYSQSFIYRVMVRVNILIMESLFLILMGVIDFSCVHVRESCYFRTKVIPWFWFKVHLIWLEWRITLKDELVMHPHFDAWYAPCMCVFCKLVFFIVEGVRRCAINVKWKSICFQCLFLLTFTLVRFRFCCSFYLFMKFSFFMQLNVQRNWLLSV